MKFKLSPFQCLGEAFRDSGAPFRSRIALIEADRETENGRWIHGQVHAEAKRVSALLSSMGIKPGERCAILMSNQSKWIFSALGALWSGAVLVPLDYKLTPKEQLALLAHCQPRVLITEWNLAQTLRNQSSNLHESMKLVVTEAPEGAKLHDSLRWENDPQASFQYRGRLRSDPATILYSSGTGGKAKGCILTHESYLRQIEDLANIVQPTVDDRIFSIIPTNHAIDFMCGFSIPLISGASVVHQRTLRSQYIVSTLKKYHITLTALVPLLLKAMKQGIEGEIEKLPTFKKKVFNASLRLSRTFRQTAVRKLLAKTVFGPVHARLGGELRQIIAGGAFVDPALADFFYHLGIPIAIGYGLTEAGTAIAFNDLNPYRGDTVGKPLPGTTIEIREANENGIGEVWVKGPSLMQGYLEDPDLTREVLIDGWLRTGDLGFLDDTGHLKLVGRSKNMIVTDGGKNIYPEDIERAFEDIPECDEFCIFAANYLWPKHELKNEKLVIAVRPKKMSLLESLAEEIRKRNRTLADFKRISAYCCWDKDFPRTATMKIKRQQLALEMRQSWKDDSVLKAL